MNVVWTNKKSWVFKHFSVYFSHILDVLGNLKELKKKNFVILSWKNIKTARMREKTIFGLTVTFCCTGSCPHMIASHKFSLLSVNRVSWKEKISVSEKKSRYIFKYSSFECFDKELVGFVVIYTSNFERTRVFRSGICGSALPLFHHGCHFEADCTRWSAGRTSIFYWNSSLKYYAWGQLAISSNKSSYDENAVSYTHLTLPTIYSV